LAVVRKSEFAKLGNVTKGLVSQWIAKGYISGAAIVGEGRSAMIDVDIARAQVKERRAVNESCGLNGLNTKLDAPAPGVSGEAQAALALPAPPVVHAPPAAGTTEDPATVDARIKAEKLKQNEILTRKQEMEELTRHGKWMVASEVTGEMNRLAAEMIRIFEGCFPDLASAVAAKFQVSQREVLHLLRGEFRQAREQLVATRKAAVAQSE
jgi:hypothetical protein